MDCCGNCVGDAYLEKVIIPTFSEKIATCSYCGSENQVVLPPSSLRDYFEDLVSIYQKEESGGLLTELLADDWGFFRNPALTDVNGLLAELLGCDISGAKYKVADDSGFGSLKSWEAFRSEIMHENRFFPSDVLDIEHLQKLIDLLKYTPREGDVFWYRTRIQSKLEEVYAINEMGAPPKNLARHGRANPVGIPYLYLASDKITAVSETRPHTGEAISIAKFDIASDLNLVDLRNPRLSASPFDLEDHDQISISTLRGDIRLLERLGQELTRPVLPGSAALEYIPTQYLCELIKNFGYDGVIYRSAMGDGINLALFDSNNATPISVQATTVSRVSVALN